MSSQPADAADVLVLEHDALCFVALLDAVRAFGRASDAGSRDEAGTSITVDLDVRLGLSARRRSGDGCERLIQVRSPAGPVTLRTSAALRLGRLPVAAFWRLPRLLRGAGCSRWLRGVVDMTHGPMSGVAMWIDLVALGLEQGAMRAPAEAGRASSEEER